MLGTDLVIAKPSIEDGGPVLCRAVQKLVNEEGRILFTDFKELVINIQAESESPLVGCKFVHKTASVCRYADQCQRTKCQFRHV